MANVFFRKEINMDIILVRHGIAVNRSEVENDEKRWLTKEGKLKTVRAAQGLGALGVRPDLICSSPLTRAMQTAEIISQVLSSFIPLSTTSALAPRGTPEQIIRWLSHRTEKCIMLVSHMPNVAEAASVFCTDSHDLNILFKKAAACRCSFAGKPARAEARLDWLLQPKQLRQLASR